MQSSAQLDLSTVANRSFDATISSTQESFAEQPSAKRPREDDEPSIQEVSEIMKMLLENNPDLDAEQIQVKPTTTMAPLYTPTESVLPPKPPLPLAKPHNRGSSVVCSKSFMMEQLKFNCRFCRKGLSTQGRNKKHENECIDNPNREIATCDVCHSQMKPSSMTHHKNSKHGAQSSPIPNPPVLTVEEVDVKLKQLPIVTAASVDALDDINSLAPARGSDDDSQMQICESGDDSRDTDDEPLVKLQAIRSGDERRVWRSTASFKPRGL